jgi:shikimate kinase
MNITLIGMKHCGKSTLGAALAAKWRCPFYDVDRMIESHYACDTGELLGFREIFAKRGEDYFAELESKVVCELYLRVSEAQGSHVIAVGGRTALNKRVSDLLSALGLIVYLEVSPEELFARVTHAGLPPFLDEKDPAKHFLDLCRERTPHYRRLANLTINLGGLDADAAFRKLRAAIEQQENRPSPVA